MSWRTTFAWLHALGIGQCTLMATLTGAETFHHAKITAYPIQEGENQAKELIESLTSWSKTVI